MAQPVSPAARDAVLHWQWSPFEALTTRALHDALVLRCQVFVYEQQCVFQDADGLDPEAWHLLGWARGEEPGAAPVLAAYARIFAPGVRYAEASIGRVVLAPTFRGGGLGRALMLEALARIRAEWPGAPVRLEAQERLQRFYESLGFTVVSAPYLDDGIVHVKMTRGAP